MKYLTLASEISIPAPIKKATSDEFDSVYTRNAIAHLHALYQIGRTAVLSKKHTDKGIAAMKSMFSKMENSQFDSADLPREPWGRARLAELLIAANDKEQANAQLSLINLGEDKDLKKAVKKLRKNAR